MLRSVTESSTSDHKPILAAFEIQQTQIPAQPTLSPLSTLMDSMRSSFLSQLNLSSGRRSGSDPRSSRSSGPLPVVRLSHLEVSCRDSGANPYAIFFTNPPGLLGSDPLISRVAKRGCSSQRWSGTLPSGKLSLEAEGESEKAQAASSKPHCKHNGAQHADGRSPDAQGCLFSWSEHQVPLLRPQLANHKDIEGVTLIISIYNRDPLSYKDTPFGTVLVSLSRPPRTAGSSPEYEVQLNERLVYYGCAKGSGRLTGTIRVSTAAAVSGALRKARDEKAGASAWNLTLSTLREYPSCIPCCF